MRTLLLHCAAICGDPRPDTPQLRRLAGPFEALRPAALIISDESSREIIHRRMIVPDRERFRSRSA
jgi:hypothetical protein